MVLINSLKENRRGGDALSVVEQYVATMVSVLIVVSISCARRSKDIAGRINEKNVAGETEGQTLFS